MSRTYDDIMTFYGEDSSDENARRDFFAKLASFVTEWKVSYLIDGFSKSTLLTVFIALQREEHDGGRNPPS